MQDFRTLRVWHAANSLTLAIYEATKAFPREERFGLTAQVRRAAVSIQANIAEACGRGTRRDSCRHFQIAIGSAAEVSSHLSLARDLQFLSPAAHSVLDGQLVHIRRMLIRLLLKLRRHSP